MRPEDKDRNIIRIIRKGCFLMSLEVVLSHVTDIGPQKYPHYLIFIR